MGPDYEDSDGDGLPNWLEEWLGSAPWNPDSDYDGLSDGFEFFTTGTSPINWDSDSDGYSDYDDWYGCEAVNHNHVLPGVTVYDWDGDGYYNPDDPFPFDPYNGNGPPWVDSDGDSIPDHEDAWPNDPYNGSGGGGGSGSPDSDGDGIPDDQDAWPYDPYNGNPPPTDPDTDGDGAPDNVDTHPNDGGRWSDYNNNGFNDWEDTPYNTDTDGDGVVDAYDSDPANSSLWNDFSPRNGINDDAEPPQPPDTPDPATQVDSDSDGYMDAWDSHSGNASLWSDWDNDGLNAEDEMVHGTDPQQRDTDNDGLTDGEEVQYQTNPLSPDTDGDGLTDFEELRNLFGSSATDMYSLSKLHGWGEAYTDWQLADLTDTDQDGIPDKIEDLYAPYMNKTFAADAQGDLDADLVSNLQAYQNGWTLRANINSIDRDGDGILDTIEDIYPGILDKFNPADAVEDPDGDDLMNWQEVELPLQGYHPGNAQSRYPGVADHIAYFWQALTGDVELYLMQGGAWSGYGHLSRLPEGTYNAQMSAWTNTGDANENAVPDGLEAFLADLAVGDQPAPGRVAAGDYDGDGMPDLWEWTYRLDVLDATDAGLSGAVLPPLPAEPDPGAYDPDSPEQQEAYAAAVVAYWALWDQRQKQDLDRDGLSNLMEYQLNTHPLISDSDGDSVSDGLEYQYGFDPNNGSNTPPTLLGISGGSSLSAVVGTVSGTPLTVKAVQAGLPRENYNVQFKTEGFGKVGPTAAGPWSTLRIVETNDAGLATVYWQAPLVANTGTLQARGLEVGSTPVNVPTTAQPTGGGGPGGGTDPPGPVNPETPPDPWETVRMVERSRRVLVAQVGGEFPPGSIVISPNGFPIGYFQPLSTQEFENNDDLLWFLAELEYHPWGYYFHDENSQHLAEGNLMGGQTTSPYVVTYGNLVDSIPEPTWYYGGGWGNGQDLSSPLRSSESVAATIASGQTDAPVESVNAELNKLYLPLQSGDAHWKQLPARAEPPYYCVEHTSMDSLPYANYEISAQSPIGSGGNQQPPENVEGGLQGRFLTGSKRLYWMARTRPLKANGVPDMDAELPELSKTWLRVVERVSDAEGNALPDEPRMENGIPVPGSAREILSVASVTLVMPEDSLISTQTLINGVSVVAPEGTFPGSIVLSTEVLGTRVTLLPIEVEVKRGGIGENQDGTPATPTWRSQNGKIRDVVSLWATDDFAGRTGDLKADWLQVRVNIPQGMVASLPSGTIHWEIPGQTAPPDNTLETPKLSWPGRTGLDARIRLFVAGKYYKIDIDFPDVGSLDHDDWAALMLLIPGKGALGVANCWAANWIATSWSNSYSGKSSLRNALRHSCWMAYCASDLFCGPEMAELLGKAHEHNNKVSGTWPYESTMDLHNNAEGCKVVHPFDLTGNTIKGELLTKLANGDLWIWDSPGEEHTGFKATMKSDDSPIYP